MMRHAFLLAALVLLCSCEAGPSVEQPVVTVELGDVSDSHLMLTYRSSTPLESLRFHDAGGYFRERRWEVLTEGYEFARDDSVQLMQLEDGADPQHKVDVKVHLQSDPHPRRYDHALQSTSGWVAIYSGYLGAVGMVIDRPRYIVMGNMHWIRDGETRYLFDTALPPWMTFSVRRHLPAILQFYRERLSLELEAPVHVMVSFHPDSEVTELVGAALFGQIHIGVHGTAWQEDSPWAELRLHRLLAHEAAHLWNAGLVRYVDGTPPALYEGGAEALGIRALFALGLVDAATMSESAADAVQQCAAGDERNEYACGHALANDVERRSLTQGGPDLFDLWGALLRNAQAGGVRYDMSAWEAVLTAAGIELIPCRGDTDVHPVAGTGC